VSGGRSCWEGVDWIRRERAEHGLTMDGYDVVVEGVTKADDPDAAAAVRPWVDADWSSLARCG
jgi:hypothetical protein